jgi:hypothetical protein
VYVCVRDYQSASVKRLYLLLLFFLLLMRFFACISLLSA